MQNNSTEDKHLTDTQKRGNRIFHVRKKLLKMTRDQFCQGFHYTSQSLKAWELAWGGGISESRARILVDYMRDLGVHCTVPWIMYGVGPEPKLLTQYEQHNPDGLQDDDDLAEELLFFENRAHAHTAQVTDDSLYPILRVGDYVGGFETQQPHKALDQECLVIDLQDNQYIRILKQGDQAQTYHLTSYNPHTTAFQEIRNIKLKKIIPIVWIRRRGIT